MGFKKPAARPKKKSKESKNPEPQEDLTEAQSEEQQEETKEDLREGQEKEKPKEDLKEEQKEKKLDESEKPKEDLEEGPKEEKPKEDLKEEQKEKKQKESEKSKEDLKEGPKEKQPDKRKDPPEEASMKSQEQNPKPMEIEDDEEKPQDGLEEGSVDPPQEPPKKKPKKTEKAESVSGHTLTSTRLKLHEATSEAIQGLKEGTLSETEFWNQINKTDKAAVWKKYENCRNKSPEAKNAWLQMGGPGVLEKKKQLLFHFLRTGKAEEGCLKKSTEASSSKQDNELFEWVPWKQILDWFGKEEALQRVESGLIPVKKVAKKFFEFLLVKKHTMLTTEQKNKIAAEQELALKGSELKACKKALEAPRSQQEWENLWSERRPEKGFQVKDALSASSQSSQSDTEEECSDEDAAPTVARLFLQGLKEGSQPALFTGAQDKALVSKKENKALVSKKEKQDKNEPNKNKAGSEKPEKAGKQKKTDTWEQKVDAATQVDETEKKTRPRRRSP